MNEIINYILSYWDWAKYNIILIILILVSLTFLQKYHFKMLFYIMRSRWIFSKFIIFVNRAGIIIHEFSHLIFVVLSWAKISNITLFSKTWWNVSFEYADYIWSLPYSWGWIWWVILLIFNKFMIFLSALWPLLVWMLLNSLLMKYVLWINYFDINIWILNINNSFLSWFILFLYAIFFMPYFILSYKDMTSFVYYNWSNVFAKFFGSLINVFIFILFLLFLTYFYNYFLSFFVVYLLSFSITWLIFVFLKLIKKVNWL